MSAAGRTRWGYHQLTDPWAARLIKGAGIGPGDLVVDIGAGRGALVAPLVLAGARVIAVELHPGRVRADAADLRLPRQPFRVVANPPFGVTTAVLRLLLAPGSHLWSADLVLPAQVAARWSAGRGAGGRRWSRTFRARVVTRLPPGAFRPPATVATAVLRIERHGAGGADPHAPPWPSLASAPGPAG